jgi:UDP:flavonoid glycosyltransferase YjiC (YdhE family)
MQAKRILFANFPADGHFNPLTSLAVYLKSLGHDVRWYTSDTYAEKIHQLGIPFYPLKRALDVSKGSPDELFPERRRYKSQLRKLQFDIRNVFVRRGIEFFQDVEEIEKHFPFDLVISDITFTGLWFIEEKLGKPLIAIGVLPLMKTSRDLPPSGLGLTPSGSFWGRMKQHTMRLFSDVLLFRESNTLIRQLFRENGLKVERGNIFDTLYQKATLVLQSGTPGFEYQRSDLSPNIRFIGPLLPYTPRKKSSFTHLEKILQYSNIILVTQGTVEKDPEKIIVPTLEAFKGTDYLVIATTGSSGTENLKERYPHTNILIEDFIPFEEIMPLCRVYVTNGGYGGVLLSIENKLPLVTAGIHEGKNEINARVGYFELGINLKTETPTPAQIRASVEEVLGNPVYKRNVGKLNREFSRYNPQLLCEKYVNQVLYSGNATFEGGPVQSYMTLP